jgi:hypothetical protein
MESRMRIQEPSKTSELRALQETELDAVAGGFINTIDWSQMPDRSEQCGTMWVLDQIFKRITPRPA